MLAWRPALLCLVFAAPAWADDPQPPPAHQETIYRGEATSILGRSVFDPSDAKLGTIADVLVDDQGTPRAAVIDFGGFMGIGQRRIAVAWRALHFLPLAQNHHIRIDLTADQIKAVPEYRRTADVTAPPATVAVPPATVAVPPATK